MAAASGAIGAVREPPAPGDARTGSIRTSTVRTWLARARPARTWLGRPSPCPPTRRAALFALSLGWALLAPTAVADPLAKIVQEEHLGVATCATSQCHGKSRAENERNVQLNEYTMWADSDRHSIAYRTLESEESLTMAGKLGIGDPTEEKLCLDCHADNVPAALRGPKFRLSDGVGCEGCHGGSGRWIETHTNRETTHAENVAAGLIETEKPDVRAEVCLSCHLGTEDKFATHRIMAAGHPRLSFELELFSANQPAHYTVDEDYIERKGRIPTHRLWLAGQLQQQREYLEVSRELLGTRTGLLPELSLFDCHSCHHPMEDIRWTRRRGDGLEPGSLRLHLPNMVVLQAVASAFGEGELVPELQDAHRRALRGAQGGRDAFATAAERLLGLLDEAAGLWAAPMDVADVARMRLALLTAAGEDRASDYAEAEQIYFGFESLCHALNEIDRCGPGLDSLFETVADARAYSPSVFARTAREIAAAF